MLAAVATAAVIFNGRFHGNAGAEVAPCAQFDETLAVGADASHRHAFDFPGFTTSTINQTVNIHCFTR